MNLKDMAERRITLELEFDFIAAGVQAAAGLIAASTDNKGWNLREETITCAAQKMERDIRELREMFEEVTALDMDCRKALEAGHRRA